MSLRDETRGALIRAQQVLVAGWSRFAAYEPPETGRPARYCPYTALALVTGGPVPDPYRRKPEGFAGPDWQLCDFLAVIRHNSQHPAAREAASRLYAAARRSPELPELFTIRQRDAYEVIGLWNASHQSPSGVISAMQRIANNLSEKIP